MCGAASKTLPGFAISNAHLHLCESVDLKYPFWMYCEIFRQHPYAFLLDSALESDRLGRYSFMGTKPRLVYRVKRLNENGNFGRARIELRALQENGEYDRGHQIVPEGQVFPHLQRVLQRFQFESGTFRNRPGAFMAGAVGYLGYEAGRFIEKIPSLAEDELALPDVNLMFCDTILGHNHKNGDSYVSIVGRGESDAEARENAFAQRDGLFRAIEDFEPSQVALRTADSIAQPSDRAIAEVLVESDFDESSYCEAVEQIKAHIAAGDIYQACMTHRLTTNLDGHSPWELYCHLRTINPAPFAAYLKFPEAEIVSASPERFLKLDERGIAESRPIKGTRPRGDSAETDLALEDELRRSVKDRAENVMIVDLVRNDFGRVCRSGSVTVPELMTIEKYATVFQMVSTIRGELDDGFDAVDLARACFPGGSMTGAPKIEAMKILDRLEPVQRGVYSGAIGYFDFGGTLDLSIVIRTFIVKDNRCYFHVGGAVVADSDPRSEYLETMDKARALKMALAVLRDGL